MYPRIKEIIINYNKDGLKSVYEYLTQNNMIIDNKKTPWAYEIKRLIENNNPITAILMIELIGYKLLNDIL